MATFIKLQFVAQCDKCTETQDFRVPAEEMGLDEFAAEGKAHFEAEGWQFFGGSRCPRHARKAVAANEDGRVIHRP